MRLRQLIVLVLASLLFGVYLYYGIQKPAEQKEVNKEQEDRLAKFEPTLLEKITLKTQGEKDPIELVKEKRVWKLTAPIKDVASSARVESLVAALEKFKKSKVILTQDEVSKRKELLNQYGLDKPRLNIEYKTSSMAAPQTIRLGNANPANTGDYAQAGSTTTSDASQVTLATLDLDGFITQKVDDFREMRLTTVNASDFAEVSFDHVGKQWKFKRNDKDHWEMVSPYPGYPLDTEYTNNQIEKVAFLRANKFVGALPTAFKGESKIVVGFKDAARDDRTSESDKRPHGIEIVIGKIKKPKAAKVVQKADKKSDKKKKDPDEKPAEEPEAFDYYASTDKTPPAEIARFHFDNFVKAPEDFILRTFDNYNTADIKKITFRAKNSELVIQKTDLGYHAKAAGKESDILLQQLEGFLKPIRTLHAVKFMGTAPSLPVIGALEVTFEFASGKSRIMKFQIEKDVAHLFVKTEDDVRLHYLLAPKAIDFDGYTFDKIPKPEAATNPAAGTTDAVPKSSPTKIEKKKTP